MMIKPITEYRTKRKYNKVNRNTNGEMTEAYKGFCLYAVSESLSGCIKVGRSKDLGKRMITYSTSSPLGIRIEGAVFLSDGSLLSEAEKRLHHLLRERGFGVSREWYSISADSLRLAMNDVCDAMKLGVEKRIGIFLTVDKPNREDPIFAYTRPARKKQGRPSFS